MTIDLIMDIFVWFGMAAILCFIAMYVVSVARYDSEPDDYSSPERTYASCAYISTLGFGGSFFLREAWRTSEGLGSVFAVVLTFVLWGFVIHFLSRILGDLRTVMEGRKEATNPPTDKVPDTEMSLEEALKILANMEVSFEPLGEREEQARRIVEEALNAGRAREAMELLEKVRGKQNNAMEPCFSAMGFTRRPTSEQEVKAQFRRMAKICHPDHGGSGETFIALKNNYQKCLDAIRREQHTGAGSHQETI